MFIPHTHYLYAQYKGYIFHILENNSSQMEIYQLVHATVKAYSYKTMDLFYDQLNWIDPKQKDFFRIRFHPLPLLLISTVILDHVLQYQLKKIPKNDQLLLYHIFTNEINSFRHSPIQHIIIYQKDISSLRLFFKSIDCFLYESKDYIPLKNEAYLSFEQKNHPSFFKKTIFSVSTTEFVCTESNKNLSLINEQELELEEVEELQEFIKIEK